MKRIQITRSQLIDLIGPLDVIFDITPAGVDYKLRSGRLLAQKINDAYYEVKQ
ncbi:hypothetical protein Acj133p002 [Acinetobacter phage 133]|uniref:Uncharacterized protein n=1 Tax=Acinetobacter phage 133 TaxID=2919552 RepID=D9I5W8_9CAUD|nr:hypothetical protein Acj133p002 [Acinetobacter phage 133]ADJ19349.1 hypothetical protein Acj133p002 [Acinetobacter phage 133]